MIALVASFYSEADPKVDDDLWYQKPNHEEVIRRFQSRLKDPYYNVMAFEEWEELSNISLTVLASEMDSMLDQGLVLAKKWQGPVTFNVAWGLPHGFINMKGAEAKDDSMNFANLMEKALGLEPLSEGNPGVPLPVIATPIEMFQDGNRTLDYLSVLQQKPKQ